MANLIIKPTSGGSLVLQDEGGTAAHTIDASGNHTLSGTTNNLGTVTAGTFNSTIGSSATFPISHIIHHDIKYTSGTVTTTANSFQEVSSSLRITHTGAHTDNIFIFDFSTAGMSCDGNQMFMSVANTAAVTTGLTTHNSMDYNDTTKVPGLIRSYISASTSTITYTPVFRNQNGSTGVNIGGMGSASNFTFSLMELRKT